MVRSADRGDGRVDVRLPGERSHHWMLSLGDRTRGLGGMPAWRSLGVNRNGTQISISLAPIQFHENYRQCLPSARRGLPPG